ncbi:MAG: aldo/keto reductase [Oxalobacter sp.]|nr:aldo/keto reductase [Oxalobacter sp.]
MRTQKLRNIKVSAVGMGCMGFSHGYGTLPPESESIRLIRKAFDLGCTHYDTAEGYGPYLNEELVGKAVKPFREKIILATKFIPATLAGQEKWDEPKMTRSSIRHALDDSLRRLQTDYIDIYYQHRVPLDSNPEEVAYWMGELIQEGKIRGWGQSQSTEEQIRKAHAITPLTAIQSEYSMMERMFEKDVIPTCKELNIGFVAFSPMASGFLSGKYNAESVYKGDDVRLAITRFHKENVIANMPLLDMLELFAKQKGATKAQLALAWMLHGNDFITPIPGMRSDARIEENLGAADVTFTDDEFAALQTALDKITVYGNRTDEDIIAMGHVKTHD